MSVLKHATISAWTRHEDGSYAAEINGWTLHVKWRPETSGYLKGRGPRPGEARRGFVWEAEKGEQKLTSGDVVYEEIEVAMAAVEERVAPDPAKHQGKTVD